MITTVGAGPAGAGRLVPRVRGGRFRGCGEVGSRAVAAVRQLCAMYPTSVLVIPGLAWMILMAARANWRDFAIGLAIVLIGIVGAFAGPAGAWAVAAVGLCVVLLGNAAVIVWQQRRSVVRP